MILLQYYRMLRQAQHKLVYIERSEMWITFHKILREFSHSIEIWACLRGDCVRLILASRLYNSIRVRLEVRIIGGLKNP